MIFIGDRGMITKARRDDLDAEQYKKVNYISALTRKEFHQFLEDQSHPIQLGIFDREKLVEVESEGVRYILSFNPEKEQEDRQNSFAVGGKDKRKTSNDRTKCQRRSMEIFESNCQTPFLLDK